MKGEEGDMMMNLIEGIYDSLTKSEKKVANYILENPEDVIHHSIVELSKIVGVGESTVHRFVRKLGYDGYQKFKIALARELSSLERESSGDPLHEIVNEIEEVAKSVKTLVKKEDIMKAVDMILNARKVIFFGVGLSGITAHYGSAKFSMLGIPSFYYNDPHMQVVVAVNLSPDDLVISISHSGNIRDTVKSTSVAKDVEAKIVVITSGINSPLSKLGDVVLYTKTIQKDIHYFMRGNIGETIMVEILFRMTLSKIKDDRNFSKVKEVLKPKRY